VCVWGGVQIVETVSKCGGKNQSKILGGGGDIMEGRLGVLSLDCRCIGQMHCQVLPRLCRNTAR